MTGWLIFGGALLLLACGEYLFVVLGIATLLCVQCIGDGKTIGVAADLFRAVNKEVLLAIPFFIVAGGLITRGKIAERLVDLARALIGWIPGGLALSAVLACMFFAAISGSSPVTLIAIGSMLYPSMLKEGYSERFSMGILSSGGTLGIIIPPSIPMIVYSIMVTDSLKNIGASGAQVSRLSVTNLFIAGVGPGLLLGGLLLAYAFFYSLRVRAPRMEFSLRRLGSALYRGTWALLLPVVILGGIYGGYFTATESAAVAVVYALLVELLIHRELKWRDVPAVLVEAAELMGQLFPILVLAYAFNMFLTFEEIPQAAAEKLAELVTSRTGFLVLVNLFLLVVGCVMDIMSAILIFAPLLAPMVASYEIDPVHFGIIFIVNLEIGYLTPPMGINLFVASGLFKKPLTEVVRAVLPFILLFLVGLGLITWCPDISLALVRAMAK